MNQCSYISLDKAKTGVPVPIFANGKPSCSLYNPEREAELFADLPEFTNTNYFVIGGCASGLHIQKLREKYPHAIICILEDTKSTIDFCKAQIMVKNKTNCIYSDIESLKETLMNTYFPPLHGNFTFQALRSWENYHSDKATIIKTHIQEAIEAISSDISVQAHFGKLWHRNILLNLKLANYSDIKCLDFEKTTFPTSKKAVICGAGSGLEYSISELIKNRDSYYIVATDTIYQVLLQKTIIADVVVTTDAQNISVYHFMLGISPKTLYVSDLSASPIAARLAYKSKCNILFYNGGHPLSQYAIDWDLKNENHKNKNRFPFFSAGAGSVTLVSLDFIFKSGFKNYAVIGADFSYLHDKTYTNGTYLDILYGAKAYKFRSIEQQFDTLLFRTPLISEIVDVKTLFDSFKCDGKTTEILEQYRLSFKNIINKNMHCKKTLRKKSIIFIPVLKDTFFNFFVFKNTFIESLSYAIQQDCLQIPKSIYPYFAYIGKTTNTINFIQKITDIINKTMELCED